MTPDSGLSPALQKTAESLHTDLLNLINTYANDHSNSALAQPFESLMRTADYIADIIYPEDPEPHYC